MNEYRSMVAKVSNKLKVVIFTFYIRHLQSQFVRVVYLWQVRPWPWKLYYLTQNQLYCSYQCGYQSQLLLSLLYCKHQFSCILSAQQKNSLQLIKNYRYTSSVLNYLQHFNKKCESFFCQSVAINMEWRK